MAPKKRRQYRTGGISLRKDGLYMGRIDAGTYPNGKRRQLCVYGKTEAEVKAKLERKRKQIASEGKSVATQTRASVRSWSAEWLAQRQKTQRPKAYATDASQVKKWIVPTIGSRKLQNLTPSDVRAVANAIRDAGLKTGTARRAHSVLIQMLKAAILEGHDVPQRVLLVEAPSVGTNDREPLPLEDAIAVLGVAAELPHGSRWVAALLQGMRPNECLGLSWSDVDFDKKLITVRWQLQPLPYIDPKNKDLGFRVPDGYNVRQLVTQWHLVELKTESGYRVIPMVPWFEAALSAWRALAPASPFDLVWPAADGAPADTADDVTEWRLLQETAAIRLGRDVRHPTGRRYVRHEARHTTATLLLEAGIDPKVITAIMGHSSILTTRGYQYVQTQLAADALGQIATQLQLAAPPHPELSP